MNLQIFRLKMITVIKMIRHCNTLLSFITIINKNTVDH